MNIEHIPSIPDREKCFEEITVDCYDEYEVLSAFEVYLTDALLSPVAASWGEPGTPGGAIVTVLGVANTDEYEGVRLRVRTRRWRRVRGAGRSALGRGHNKRQCDRAGRLPRLRCE